MEVIDLGVMVDNHRILEAARQYQADLNMKKTKRMIISFFHLRQKPHGMPVTNSSLK